MKICFFMPYPTRSFCGRLSFLSLLAFLFLLPPVTSSANCGCDTGLQIGTTDGSVTNLSTVPGFTGGGVYNNTCMSIRGRLVIDGNYQIRGGEIKMWPGSEIQVAGSLTLMNVNQNGGVHGCDKMWKGISAGWSTRVIVHNSTVQDAQYAIKYNSGARVDVSRSTFTDNFVSIYVPSSFLPVTTLFPHKITGTTFNTTGSLLPPYPGMEPYDNPLNIPYAGIWINTIPNTVLGVGSPDSLSNNFLDLRSGIISYDAKLSVSNSVFKAITDGVPLYPGGFSVGAGHAIYVSGANSKSLTVNGCTFENCQVA